MTSKLASRSNRHKAPRAREAALWSTGEVLRAIVQASPLAMFALDLAGNVMSWNPAAERIFGWTEADLLGCPNPIVPDDRRDEYDALRSRAMRGETFNGVETIRRRKDGTRIDVSISMAPLRDGNGIVSGIMAVMADITERKRAEASLRTLWLAAEQSPSAIIITDKDGNIEYVNPKLSELTGFSREEALGKNPRLWQSGTTPREVYERLWNTILSGGEWRGEICNKNKNGELYWAHDSISAVRNPDGVITHFVAVQEDVTERKRAEEQIRTLNAELERRVAERTAQLQAMNQKLEEEAAEREQFAEELQTANEQLVAAVLESRELAERLQTQTVELAGANRELEAFSYSVSHDLRAPLRAIDGFSGILIDELGSELSSRAQRYLKLIGANARQMAGLVDDLLRFSRLSRQPLTKEAVQPAEIARATFDELSLERTGRRVVFTVGDLPTCPADPALLKQVFVNLLGNALKFTRGRKVARITVGFRKVKGELAYFVKDNGAGFDMKYARKLFSVFHRLHSPEEYEGTGVGLAIVERVIQRHGGRVWAEAAVDRGATFYFTL